MSQDRTPLLIPEDEHAGYDRYQLAFARTACLILFFGSLAGSVRYLPDGPLHALAATLPFAAVGALGAALLAFGRFPAAFRLLVFGVWLCAINALVWTNGVRAASVTTIPLVILFSGWLIGTRVTLAMTLLTPLVLFALAHASAIGALRAIEISVTPYHLAFVQSLTVIAAGALGYFAARSLQSRFDRLETSRSSLRENVAELSLRERDLEGLRQRFEALFRFGPTASVIGVPGRGTVLDCNAAFAALIGRPREEILGRDAIALGYWKFPADRERAYAILEREGRLQDFETTFVTPAGEERACLLQWQLIEIEGETRMLAQIADITRLKRAEAAQRESEGRFAAAFYASPNAVLFTRARDHVVVEVNPSFERLSGYRRDMIVGRTALELGLWQDVSDRDRIMGRMLAGDAVVEEPFRAVTREGTILDCRYSGTRVEVAGEMHILSIARDVTAETRALAALAAREQELDGANRRLQLQISLHELTESVARVGHWFTDLSQDRVMWSRALFEITGAAERGPMSVAESRGIVHVEDQERYEEARRRRDGRPEVFRFRRPDGEERWVRASILRAPEVPGSTADFFGVVQDISDEYRAKLALEKLNAELEQRVAERTAELVASNAELDAFSYSVAHDLNAPLRTINGFAGILEEEAGPRLSPAEREHLKRIREGTERMGELIRDLLQLAHVTRAELRRQSVDLSALARELAADLAALQPERTVEWRVQPGVVANADPGLARVLLRNLLENAWKYTRDQPRPVIEFRAIRGEGGETEFQVRDNGAGFDMHQARRLFSPFQRLHSEAEFEGTGIGLATVQRILYRHAGRIRAEAAPGKGAAFSFTLPPAGAA